MKINLKKILGVSAVSAAMGMSLNSSVLADDHHVSNDHFNTTFNPLSQHVHELKSQTQKVNVAGYGYGSYVDSHDRDSTFSAAFNPILTYHINEQLLFEGELGLMLDDGDTDIELEQAYLSYLFNDHVSVGIGKFASPFGFFNEYVEQDWINKLPDNPLGYTHDENQLVPDHQIGAQVRGMIPVADGELHITAYISNGPSLKIDVDNAGELEFENTNDNNNNKAVGGRISFLPPIEDMVIGASVQLSQVGESGTDFDNVDSELYGVDFSWKWLCEKLLGVFDFKGEYIWSHVDSIDYGTAGGDFKNNREAYYAQIAYMPTQASSSILQQLEFVFRFDSIEHPEEAPTSRDLDRWTAGINFWMTPASVVKVAFQDSDDQGAGTNEDNNAFLLEVAAGF